MPANDKKPQVEVPEEVVLDDLVVDDNEDQPVLPKSRPETVSEADWVDQQTDVPIDEDEEYS